MDKKISLVEACRLTIKEQKHALVTKYGVWLLIVYLYKENKYKEIPLNTRSKAPKDTTLSRVISQLNRRKSISDDLDFGTNVYRCNEVPDQSPEELCCIVDPFAYVSHLSAMQRYLLSDRRPAELILTTAPRALRHQLTQAKEEADFADALDMFGGTVWMRLPHYSVPNSVRNRPIHLRKTVHFGHWQPIRGTDARISTIGQTFLDMLLEPTLSGGMHHVIDVWHREGPKYLDDIIAAVDGSDSKIAKVRAGYLLEEKLNIATSDSRVQSWKSFAQRGGSRKLDPSKPYLPKWSENWSISLNV